MQRAIATFPAFVVVVEFMPKAASRGAEGPHTGCVV
jgi:hypothetical protein